MKRMDFLRRMRDSLGYEDCEDKQLKKGFDRFLKAYTDTKDKLEQSGFGIDPEKDATLKKGNLLLDCLLCIIWFINNFFYFYPLDWILKKCPYFEILDEVMGSRPNLRPPFIDDSANQNLSSMDPDDLVPVGNDDGEHGLLESYGAVELEVYVFSNYNYIFFSNHYIIINL
jgi:hypothetical protein